MRRIRFINTWKEMREIAIGITYQHSELFDNGIYIEIIIPFFAIQITLKKASEAR